MGFVQFPASDTELAKSGPGVAQHLAHAYKEYLAAFDNVYVSTVMDSRRKNDALTAAQRPPLIGGNAPPQLPMRAGGIADPSQMQLVMAYANIPLPELRRRGIPEQLIQFIENNRTTLLRNATEQGIFRNQIARPDQARPMQPTGQQPFGGSPPAAGGMGNGMMAPGQPFMQHPGMHNNQMENQQQQQQPPQPGSLARPSREHLQAAMAHITKLKSDYSPERTFHI
jgi:hypothetical protein